MRETVCIDPLADVMGHILFHKSIVVEDDSHVHLDNTLDLVRRFRDQQGFCPKNEFERSLTAALALTIEHGMDPWNIDLLEFSKMYISKIRKDKDVDLITAGRLIFMAWSILRMQSDECLARIDPQEPEEEWIPPEDILFETDEAMDFTLAVMEGKNIPLNPMVWRDSKKKWGFVDIASGLLEANLRAVELQEAEKRRLSRVSQLGTSISVEDKIHAENAEEDLARVTIRLLQIGHKEIPFATLHQENDLDRITCFIALLFMVQHGKIELVQKNFPYGEITIISHLAELGDSLEDALEAPAIELVAIKDDRDNDGDDHGLVVEQVAVT